MVVVMKDGALLGSEVFPSGTYRMGRGQDMDLRLDDARVSDHHASFLFVNGQVGIRDEGSENGIFVVYIHSWTLRPGSTSMTRNGVPSASCPKSRARTMAGCSSEATARAS